MISIENELKKIALRLLILNELNQKELSGLDIITTLQKKSLNYINLDQSYIYNKLYALQEDKLIDTKIKSTSLNELPSKVYFLTNKGLYILDEDREIFSYFIEKMNILIK